MRGIFPALIFGTDPLFSYFAFISMAWIWQFLLSFQPWLEGAFIFITNLDHYKRNFKTRNSFGGSGKYQIRDPKEF